MVVAVLLPCWVGPGDDGSQAEATTNVVTAWVFLSSGCAVAPRILSLRAPDLVDIEPFCSVAGPRERGMPTAACSWGASLLPVLYIPIPLSPLAPTQHMFCGV